MCVKSMQWNLEAMWYEFELCDAFVSDMSEKYMSGLVHECGNSSASALELAQTCTMLSIKGNRNQYI